MFYSHHKPEYGQTLPLVSFLPSSLYLSGPLSGVAKRLFPFYLYCVPFLHLSLPLSLPPSLPSLPSSLPCLIYRSSLEVNDSEGTTVALAVTLLFPLSPPPPPSPPLTPSLLPSLLHPLFHSPSFPPFSYVLWSLPLTFFLSPVNYTFLSLFFLVFSLPPSPPYLPAATSLPFVIQVS